MTDHHLPPPASPEEPTPPLVHGVSFETWRAVALGIDPPPASSPEPAIPPNDSEMCGKLVRTYAGFQGCVLEPGHGGRCGWNPLIERALLSAAKQVPDA